MPRDKARRTSLLFAALFLLLFLPASGGSAGEAQTSAWTGRPDIPSVWSTTEGKMTLHQGAGDTVEGEYATDNGQLVSLTWTNAPGPALGASLHGTWIETDADKKCSRRTRGSPYWGWVTFTFDAAGEKFNGIWGYCNDTDTQSGTWSGTRTDKAPSLHAPPFTAENNADVNMNGPKTVVPDESGNENGGQPNAVTNPARGVCTKQYDDCRKELDALHAKYDGEYKEWQRLHESTKRHLETQRFFDASYDKVMAARDQLDNCLAQFRKDAAKAGAKIGVDNERHIFGLAPAQGEDAAARDNALKQEMDRCNGLQAALTSTITAAYKRMSTPGARRLYLPPLPYGKRPLGPKPNKVIVG